MPPSPALRFSPGREPRSESHKRGRSLESGLLFREKDDDLALFNEVQSRERENFLLQSSDDLEDPFSTKLRHFSDIKLGFSIPSRGETSDLLNADGQKNDYDWLLTPPDTPLFPSLDDEPPQTNVISRGRPRNKPISISRSSTMEKSYKSSRGSASPNRLSLSPRSGNNTFQSKGRPSSVPNSSPTLSLQNATPSRRPSPPPNKPAPRSSSPTPRRISTGSGGHSVLTGIRGTSPVKTSRGNSASPKIKAWQNNIPGLSSEAPPNLRTSLGDRPASYVRGSSPASRNGKDSTYKFSRQPSPTASRISSSFHGHDRDQLSSPSKGSFASSADDDLDSVHSITVGSLDRHGSRRGGSFSNSRTPPSFSKKSARMASPNSAPKRSLDSSLRQMDRKSPQDMFRPLLSSVPYTTFYVGKANSAQRSLVSRNSSITTSSNASSDHGTSFAPDTEVGDHNQDDVEGENEKTLFHDIHEEVFSFDKIDVLNANIEHEINDESIDVQHIKSRDRKIVLGHTESEYSVHHCIDTEFNERSETSHVSGDIFETSSFENTAICSHCGCHYKATDQAENDIRLCSECSRKNTLLRHIIPETTVVISEETSVISSNMRAEEKLLTETDRPTVVCELSQETDMGDTRFPLDAQDAEEICTLSSQLIQDQSQQNFLPSSMVEGSGKMPTNQLEVDQSGVDNKKPDDHSRDQQLYLSINRPNLKVDLLEGTGISVLLKRSSSSKGPVVQGRSFTATTISYDDLSFAKGSVNSTRSTTGHGSYSASSSFDFSSTKHAEFRVERQSSGRKLDVNCGYDTRIKRPSTGSSFSGTSNHSHHGLDSATQETSGNTECDIPEEIPLVLREARASENAVANTIDASSMGSIVVEENKLEYHDCGRVTDVCGSELNQAAGIHSDDNSVTSFPNHGDCISYGNVEDHSNIARSVSNTDPETSVKDPESSFDEKQDVKNSDADGLESLVTTNTTTIAESEIEGENCCQNDTGVVEDDPSPVSKSTIDDFQEHSVPNSANDCLTASVSELNTSKFSSGIEESTVTVECQGAGNARSLTLEEATDTILFCSSIIHDLAYQAATIAMEKEASESLPFEGSEPTVTILRKPHSDRKDSRSSRSVSKRTLKPQKAEPEMVETNGKSPSTKTENDENVDESLPRIVGLPNKIDNTEPPNNKLESKCNCTIM